MKMKSSSSKKESSAKMAEKENNYEEIRKKRVEENKRRMQELNLPQLSQSFKPPHSPKPSPMKRAKPRVIGTEMVEVRRSTHVQNLPKPVYKEVVVNDRDSLPKRKYSYPRKDLDNRVYASDEARDWATTKAEELEASLKGGYPSFVKSMLQSHVTGGFWLGLPSHFCKKNLPRNDETVTLTDEDGNEVSTVYFADRAGLSGGWRGFAITHELVDGDALVFQLVARTVFKVYIIRCKGYEEGESDEALEA